MRDEEGWSDITIHNVSSRGLMMRSLGSLARGDYIEIRKGMIAIIGRVVWSKNGSYGVRSQDRIDIAGLLGEAGGIRPLPDGERRESSRSDAPPLTPAALAARAERSRRLARAFQWLSITAGIVVTVGVIAHTAHTALSAPLRQARAMLGPAAPAEP